MSVSIALFTRDLRVHDNPVLRAAARAQQVVPLFVVDDGIHRAGYLRPNRAAFLADCLADLDRQLRASSVSWSRRCTWTGGSVHGTSSTCWWTGTSRTTS